MFSGEIRAGKYQGPDGVIVWAGVPKNPLDRNSGAEVEQKLITQLPGDLEGKFHEFTYRLPQERALMIYHMRAAKMKFIASDEEPPPASISTHSRRR